MSRLEDCSKQSIGLGFSVKDWIKLEMKMKEKEEEFFSKPVIR